MTRGCPWTSLGAQSSDVVARLNHFHLCVNRITVMLITQLVNINLSNAFIIHAFQA